MLYIIFQYGKEPVLIQRIIISIEAIMKNILLMSVRPLPKVSCNYTCNKYVFGQAFAYDRLSITVT